MDGKSIVNGPIKNEIYTSEGNVMIVASLFSGSDWFDCNWTTVVTAVTATTSTALATTALVDPETTTESQSPLFISEF